MTTDERQQRKCYGQSCPVARALDLIGDRWTILIIRELLGGPAHFRDLLDGLPGVPKNLLTTRLRRLEADGIVRRVKQGTASVYALSERGAAAREAIDQLAFWAAAMPPVGETRYERSVRAIAMALQAILGRASTASAGSRRVIELEVDGESVEVVLGPNPTVTVRPVTDGDARVRSSVSALSQWLDNGTLDRHGIVHVSGDSAVTESLLRALSQTAD